MTNSSLTHPMIRKVLAMRLNMARMLYWECMRKLQPGPLFGIIRNEHQEEARMFAWWMQVKFNEQVAYETQLLAEIFTSQD